MKRTLCLFPLILGLAGSTLSHAQTTATPTITLASGTYVMPQNTTITDATAGASILWCYAASGTCTPATTYSGSIYIDPTSTETICANATASGHSKSATACNYYTNGTLTATPVITLASGTYVMPQNTTITDATSGASILWCYVASGTCTPATTYSGSIYIDPASAETICADATASGHVQSATTCNTYTASSGAISFSYAGGKVTMSTSLPNADIFYTLDGSAATEASVEYISGAPVAVASGTTINAVAVQMTSGGNSGVVVQNGQATESVWKTNLACYQDQCATYSGSYSTPKLNYAPGAIGCSPYSGTCVNNTTSNGWNGVQGIPTEIALSALGSVPSASGAAKTSNFNFTTEGYPNSSIDGTAGGSSKYYGTQVLWPYDTGGGCDTCTTMVEDFYIWPGQNAASVENWELDMNSWKETAGGSDTGPVYLGASFQCSVIDKTWQYNGQAGGWSSFSPAITHDCPLPTGTLSSAISATATSFSVTPNASASTVEPGMIVWFNNDGTNEEVLCLAASGSNCTSAKRGYAGTTAAAHANSATYAGSVHVQYHVTFDPGYTNTCVLRGTSTAAECVFIDYMMVNNNYYGSPQYTSYLPSNVVIHANSPLSTYWGTQTINSKTYSALTVPADTLSSTYPDRVFDQKQIDAAASVGSTSNPVKLGEYIDQDNVTASYGVLASQTYVVP